MNRITGTATLLLFQAAVFPILASSQEKPAAEKPVPGELPAEIDMAGRYAQNYTLTFQAKLDEERFQVVRERTANYPQTTFVVKLGEKTGDGKIKIEKYERKEGVSALGVRVDTSELTVTWLETGEEVIITRRVPETISTYFARLKSDRWEEFVKEGNPFTLPGKPEVAFKLVKVEQETAHVEWRDVDGKLRSSKIEKEK